MQHLAGICAQTVVTNRIRSHCLFSGDSKDEPVIFLHGNLSAATFFEETMLAMPENFCCIAPDLRGYGDSEDLPIDATRGIRDLSDDLVALMEALQLPSAHLLGWSAGAGVAMQLTLDHSSMVRSLTLVAPVSPFGFGGTCDIHGTPNSSDFSGCGAGTVNPDAIEQMRLGNSGLSSAMAPRQLLRNYFVNTLTPHPREDMLVDAMLKQKLGDQRYPGDYVETPNAPYMAPGKWGPINALSPKFFNVSGLADLSEKPPILWLRGTADCIISDASLFDIATVLRDIALAENDLETAKKFRLQPMVAQMRQLLDRYKQNHGSYEEIVLADTGHTPFIEEQELFLKQFTSFLSSV